MKLNFRNNCTGALFVNEQCTSACKVYDLYEALRVKRRPLLAFATKYYETLLLNDKQLNLSEFLKEQKIKNIDHSRLILFAHWDNSNSTLIGYNGCRIKAAWFDRVTKNNILIFFAPAGATMLKAPDWAQKFPKWVSFTNHFEFLEGLPVLERERKTLFPKLMNIILVAKDTKEIKAEFIKVMDEIKERISFDKSNYSDNVALIYVLNMNQDNLEAS